MEGRMHRRAPQVLNNNALCVRSQLRVWRQVKGLWLREMHLCEAGNVLIVGMLLLLLALRCCLYRMRPLPSFPGPLCALLSLCTNQRSDALRP